MTKRAIDAIIGCSIVIGTGLGAGYVGTRLGRDRPPVFVDLGHVLSDSAVGRSAASGLQARSQDRRQRAALASDAAAKLPPGSKERAAKEAEAQQLSQRAQQEDAADGREVDAAFKVRVGAVLAKLYPGRVAIPVTSLAGGEDVTAAVVSGLDADNVDAVGKLADAQRQLAEMQHQLAESQRQLNAKLAKRP